MMAQEWNGQSRGGRIGNEIFIFLIRKCGLGAAYVLLAFVCVYFIPFAPKATASVWKYARKILGYGRWKSAVFLYRNYFAFGQSLIDKVAIASGLGDRFSYDYEDGYRPDELFKEGKGLVVIGAHFGGWAAGMRFYDGSGVPIHLVMFDNEAEEVRKATRGIGNEGFDVIPVNGSGMDHVFSIMAALQRGETVCFQGDRYMNGEHILPGKLLGHDADFPSGPFLIAAKMRMPVLFYFVVRERGRRFKFVFKEMQTVENEKITPDKVLGGYLKALEDVLGRHPEQWYNYYDYWK